MQDSHVAEVERLMALTPRILFTPFHRVELIHGVTQHVFRGILPWVKSRIVLDDLETDCRESVWFMVDQPRATFARCELLAHKHVATLGVRTLDSLHVAAALELGATRFWTFDQRQARLAEAEGLSLD